MEKIKRLPGHNCRWIGLAGDHTHTNAPGAALNAASVVEGIKRLKNCTLSSDLSAQGPIMP